MKYIGCGKYNKHYKYIILTAFFAFITNVLFGYGYCRGFDILKLPNTDTQLILSHHIIIHNIYRHIGILIISFFLYNIEKYISKSENETKAERARSAGIILLHDDIENKLVKKSILNIIFIIIIYIIQDNLTIIYYKSELYSLELWMLELPILSFFHYILLKFRIYDHHKLSIYLCAIFSLSCKLLSVIFSFFSEDYLIYNQNIILIPIGIFSYLIIILLRGYTLSEIKISMDLRYISPSKLLIIYGIIGIIVNVIICVVSTYIKCKSVGDFDIHICNIYNKNNNENYLDNYDIYLQILSDSTNKEMIIEIITSLIAAITYLLYIYFYILIIKYLTPVHTLFAALVNGFFVKIISIIHMLISNKNNSPSNEGNQNSILINFKNIFDFLSSTFACVGLFVFLELIELRFCNLHFNLRANIMRRSLEEIDYFKVEETDEERENVNNNSFTSSNYTELSDIINPKTKENEKNENE